MDVMPFHDRSIETLFDTVMQSPDNIAPVALSTDRTIAKREAVKIFRALVLGLSRRGINSDDFYFAVIGSAAPESEN